MKNTILFDTSVGTTNKGDDIIMQSTEEGLRRVTKGSFVVKIPTHTTPFSVFQTIYWWKAKWVQDADLKFICGTNLFATNMRYPVNDFNINIFNSKPLMNSIFVGVGNSKLDKQSNWYTRLLYNRVLSKDYTHALRDDESTQMLKELGYNAVTTGCPTLWSLTEEHCKEIPKSKAENVVFTLTGVQRDKKRDQIMLDTLKQCYKFRYFYVQTIWDYEYLLSMEGIEDVQVVSPSLNEYAEFLQSMEVDYVGTRLHGGVFAMQHKKRTIIITIDNRTRNINKVNNLNVIERSNIHELKSMIDSNITTDVRVDYEVLDKWMSQFV